MRAKPFVGCVQVFLDKTESDLKNTELGFYLFHALQIMEGRRFGLLLTEKGLNLIRFMQITMDWYVESDES